jgi:HTH-type transcriptional regulator / antitoxin HigA
MIRPLRSQADYDAALKEIERYFEEEPKPGTSAADRRNFMELQVKFRSAAG